MPNALIHEGRVVQVVADGARFPVGGMRFEPCTDVVQPGYAFADGVFTAPAGPPAATYDELRRQHYPPIGDQLDAIWKFIAKRENNGVVIAGDVTAILQDVEAVKLKYPKPA